MTVKYTDNNSRGNQQGFIYGALWSASIVAPFIGGFLIKQFSYPILFLVSLLLILIGGVVSLFLKMDVSIKKKFNLFPKLNS